MTAPAPEERLLALEWRVVALEAALRARSSPAAELGDDAMTSDEAAAALGMRSRSGLEKRIRREPALAACYSQASPGAPRTWSRRRLAAYLAGKR